MSVSLEQVNLLVWRYMKESGFQHAAFLFESESFLETTHISNQQLPTNSLVSLLQKACRYLKYEKIVNRARNNPDSEEFKNIENLEKQFPEIEEVVEESEAIPSTAEPIQLTPSVAAVLAAHRLTVYCCRWSPVGGILATASEDGTVILWDISAGRHLVIGDPMDGDSSEKDITCLDWRPDGMMFAAGSVDTTVHIYNTIGNEITKLSAQKHYMFVVKFNPAGDLLVTGSADHSTVLYSVPRFEKIAVLDFNTDTILDVAWKDNRTFATASADSRIAVCQVSGTSIFLTGHSGPVNVIAYNRTGSILASGGEDATIRLWKDGSSESTILFGHNESVSVLEWVPNNERILVSGSADGVVKVWDAEQCECLRTMSLHEDLIVSMNVSPNGEYLVTGSKDQKIVVSRISDGTQVVAFVGNSEVYDTKWDPSGMFIAAGFEDATAVVIPIHQYLS